MRVIVNGVGIAGPTLAYWLRLAGHDVVLVEAAPALRTGGYAIDFWGIGYAIAEKMGLRPRLEALGWRVEEMRYVDRRGHKTGGFPVTAFTNLTDGRYVQLRRSDLSAALYASLDGEVETLFGDSVAGIDDMGDVVRVSFDRAPPREADLVVGADGLHSRVRQLLLGEGSDREVALGYHVAAFELEHYRPYEPLVAVGHAVPGRQITRLSMPGDRTLCLFVFRDEFLHGQSPSGDQAARSALRRSFADVGWECPRMLAKMDQADTIYFDSVNQIRLPHWTKGRVALIGDAAASVSLVAGEGTGLAMAEAYALARELEQHRGDHAAAFARFEQRLMPFLESKQRAAARFASSFAPRSRIGIVLRDHISALLSHPLIARFFIGRMVRDDIDLPPWPRGSAVPRQ